jgi:riboflavin kinase/FMN adenylyltransferase
VVLDGAVVSSSRIRELLQNGRVAKANRLLQHPYVLCGVLTYGEGRGARHGFATANLELGEDMLRLINGVYATEITVRGKTYTSISNFGVRPTFSGTIYRAETHIPGFSGDLHGEYAVLRVLDFMRTELKFSGAAALAAQIKKDISARSAFGKWEMTRL